MQTSPLGKSTYVLTFGPFVLESDDLLRIGNKRVHLFPKQLETLRHLVSRSGTVVTKDELLSHVWRDAFVCEGSLHQCISAIRKQLSDAAGGLDAIETIAKRGYRFILPVTTISSYEKPRGDTAPVLRIGVLQFDCKSVAWPPDQAARLTTRVAALLSQLRIIGLEVINQAAMDRISEGPLAAAEQLGLSLLVTGQIFQENDACIGAQVEILRASDQTILSARIISPVSAGQLDAKVAACIARQIPLTESGFNRDEIAEAIEAGEECLSPFLKGVAHLRGMFSPCVEGRREEDPRLAIRCFLQAAERDSRNLASLVGLANSVIFANSRGLISAEETVRLGKYASESALAIDSGCLNARAALGVLDWIFDDQQLRGEHELRAVLDESPFHFTATEFLAIGLMRDGRITEAIQILRDSLQFGRDTAVFRSWLAYALFLERRFESSLREATTCAELFPNWEVAWAYLCFVAAHSGDYRTALEAGSRLSRITNDGALLALEAYGLARSGEKQRAEELTDYILSFDRDSSVHSALVPALVALGKSHEALSCLEQAHRLRDIWVPLVLIDSRVDAIRFSPRFMRVRDSYPRLNIQANTERRPVQTAEALITRGQEPDPGTVQRYRRFSVIRSM
jgi:DNA-binding winged helix-turn-helix (wHTH) protein/tetratricopeptide (TPR) repeat protein